MNEDGALTPKFHRLIDYTPDTGACRWKTRVSRRVFAGDIIGCADSYGYLVFKINRKSYKLHRVIHYMQTGEWPDQMDHINGKRDDNRWENLRNVTTNENMMNRKLDRRSKTGVAGVNQHRDTGRFKAYINKSKKEYFLGYFDDFFEACCARKSAEAKHGFHVNHGTMR